MRLNCIKSQLKEIATVHHGEGHVKLNSALKINMYVSLNRRSCQYVYSFNVYVVAQLKARQMGFHNCYGCLDNGVYLKSIGPRLSEYLFDDFHLCSSKLHR